MPLTNHNLKRRDRMIELYHSGLTLVEIGTKFSLSRERVRQILRGHITSHEGGTTVRAAIRAAEYQKSAEFWRLYARRNRWAAGWRKCAYCHEIDSPQAMVRHSVKSYIHRECRNQHMLEYTKSKRATPEWKARIRLQNQKQTARRRALYTGNSQ